MKKVLVLITLSATCALSVSNPAIASNERRAIDLPCQNGKTQSLLVHGFDIANGEIPWSNAKDSPLRNELSKLTNVNGFDYSKHSRKWVTDPNIGPALANRIHELYQCSGRKVIVVAHSMGGLATQFAANQVITGNKIANEIGYVVTIGTPYQGSGVALAGYATGEHTDCGRRPSAGTVQILQFQDCITKSAAMNLMPGSAGLKNLKPMPKNIPVRAIAGDVVTVYDFIVCPRGKCVIRDNGGDGIVGRESALAGVQTDKEFAGTARIYCENKPGEFAHKASCGHENLPSNPEVVKSTTEGVKAYLDATINRSPNWLSGGEYDPIGRRTWAIHDVMNVVVPQYWDGAQSMVGVYENIVDRKSCSGSSNAECDHVFVRNFANPASAQMILQTTPDKIQGSLGRYRAEHGCNEGEKPILLPSHSNVKFGGRAVEEYIYECHDTGGLVSYVWYEPQSKLLFETAVQGSDATSVLPRRMAPFVHATWK